MESNPVNHKENKKKDFIEKVEKVLVESTINLIIKNNKEPEFGKMVSDYGSNKL